MKSLVKKFNTRAAAGYTFITGNLTLLASNFDFKKMDLNLDLPSTVTAGLLLTASAIYPLTRKRPKLFAAAGSCVIAAQGIIASMAEGAGKFLQQAGTLLPAAQGALMIRKAWNAARGHKHFVTDKLYLKPLEAIDKRPILTGALIEGPGVGAIAVGAALSKDWALCAAASQWVLANVFLGVSDLKPESVQKNFSEPAPSQTD